MADSSAGADGGMGGGMDTSSVEGVDPFDAPLIEGEEAFVGEGSPPKEEAAPKPKKKAPKSKAKGSAEDGEVLRYEEPGDKEAVEGAAADEANDLEAFFEEALNPGGKKEEEEVVDDDSEEMLEGVDPESRLGKRMTKLLSERKALRGDHEASRKSAWDQYNALQQAEKNHANQMAQVAAQMADMKARVELLQKQPPPQPQVPENLTEEQKLERQWLSSLDSEMNKRVEQATKPLQDKLDQVGQFLHKQNENARLYKIKQQFKQEAETALDHVLLDGMDAESVKDQRDNMKRWLYAVANDFNAQGVPISMEDSARVLRHVALKMGLAFVRGRSKKNKEAIQRRATVPPTPRGAPHAGGAQGDPPHWLVTANGWEDVVEWDMAGRPALKRAKPPEE